MTVPTPSVPGVYRLARPRAASFPRVRTDVAGFVGVAGPRHLHETVRVSDWRSFQELYLRDDGGNLVDPPPGARLAETVRSFFANDDSRCWVVNVAAAIDESAKTQLLTDMLGVPRDPMPVVGGRPLPRIGLEQLLAQDEVAIVALPELDATRVVLRDRTEALPPSAEEAGFGCCPAGLGRPPRTPPAAQDAGRLYTPDEVLGAQRELLTRCARDRWRVFVLLAPPPGLSPSQALDWRSRLGSFDCGALYWPWLLAQAAPGEPVTLRPPLGAAAGIFARRDVVDGPHAAPANEVAADAVGLEWPVDDAVNGVVYDQGINVFRQARGQGIKLWGARTLAFSTDADPVASLGFVNVRRCLSAIERSVEAVGQREVFELNGPITWLRLSQSIVTYLRSVYSAGAFAGSSPEESFYVRCDSTLNPPDAIDRGELTCEVGVAIAAPAEFIVFRVGRREGAVQIQELA